MIPVRTKAEIESMQKACEVSMKALRAGGEFVKPGSSTAEINKAVEDTIASFGATSNFKGYGGFPSGACVSVNDTVIHGFPSIKDILKNGDIVSIDTGAIVDGWHGDNAYTFACGDISPKAKELLEVTKESLARGIAAAVPGARIGDIGHAVQSFVEANGFSVVRMFVGHGVGRKLHEAPEVPNFGSAGHGPRLVPGMTLAIEPMINEKGFDVHVLDDEWTVKTIDGGLSAHFEHTIAITKDGPLILTKW